MNPIVAFTKDWTDVPTCTTHVLRGMARTHPVLWVESVGTRRPRLGSRSDWTRALRRVRTGFGRARLQENRLRVLSPLAIPKSMSSILRNLNRAFMSWHIGRELRGMRQGVPTGGETVTEYWCFVPNAVDFLPAPRASRRDDRFKVVYYCADDWKKFRHLDGEWIADRERELLIRADVIFAVSRYLEHQCRDAVCGFGGKQGETRVHYMPHGVEHSLFARALDPGTPVPDDLAELPRPIVGFYGNVYPWIDFDLVHRLAEAKPNWTFVLIGTRYCDVHRFDGVSNVHFLGRREYGDLPSYCRGFDVAMIPYDMSNPRMESVSPVKTRELLSAGLPVVSAAVPELIGFSSDVVICRQPSEWLAALERQISRADRRSISERMRGEDWSERLREIRRIVDTVPTRG